MFYVLQLETLDRGTSVPDSSRLFSSCKAAQFRRLGLCRHSFVGGYGSHFRKL